MSLAEVKISLAAAAEAADHGLRNFDEAVSTVESASGAAQSLLRGSHHRDVAQALAALRAAAAEVQPTRRRFTSTGQRIRSYLVRLG